MLWIGSTLTVSQLVAQKIASDGAAFESPKKRYDKTRERVFVDDFDRDAIWWEIHRMHEEKKHVTLVSVCKALRDDGLFSGGRSSLGKLLARIGFGYKNINTKGEYIINIWSF